MTIKEAVKKYSAKLRNITHIPNKEVEMMLLELLGKNVIWLHLNSDKEFTQENELIKMVEKRADNYPLEYILKKASFYGEMFEVREDVLIPRPETELLVERAVEILQKIEKPKAIEIGVGSGIIAVTVAMLVKDVEVTAVDINEKALELAKANAIKFGVNDRIEFIKSDLFHAVGEKQFDVCISNPPYIADEYKLPKNVAFEPKNALFGGRVGDEILKKIIDEVLKREIPFLLCEMGYDQKKLLGDYFESKGIKDVEFYKDYEEFDRGFVAKIIY